LAQDVSRARTMAEDAVLKPIFIELQSFLARGEFAKALKPCNSILKSAPENLEALKCKTFCLIQQGQWKQALSFISSARKKISDDKLLAFERACCLYRSGKLQDALREIDTGSDSRFKLLEAQVRYRLGQFADSTACYRELLELDPNNSAVVINLVASLMSAATSSKGASEQSFCSAEDLEEILSLYERGKYAGDAACDLRAAVAMWAQQEDSDGKMSLEGVVECCGISTRRFREWRTAADAYKLIASAVGPEGEAVTGLLQSLRSFEEAEADRTSAKLENCVHLDADELENGSLPAAPKTRNARPESGDAEPKKSSKKRKRRIRYPKGFDPDSTDPSKGPDPERWLPKWQRQEYLKKAKKKGKEFRGPQGGVVKDDNAYRNQGPSTAQIDVSADSARRRRRR